jgi:ribonuclease J
VRVLYAYSHAKKLAEYDRKLLYKYKKAKIGWDEILTNPQDMVVLSKDNFYFRKVVLRKLDTTSGSKAIYSMWHGYIEQTDLSQVLESHDIKLVEIHTSGHAYVRDLKKLACALKPRYLVPIHTFYPDWYGNIHDNIVKLDDGQTYCL